MSRTKWHYGMACTQQGDTAAPTSLQVCQPWDPKKFNFTKALQKEVLFQFEPKPGSVAPEYSPAAPASTSPNLVFINVSPIEYGHVLLVPRVSTAPWGSWSAQAGCALHLVMLVWQGPVAARQVQVGHRGWSVVQACCRPAGEKQS